MAKNIKKAPATKKEAAPDFFRRNYFEILLFGFCFLLYCNSIGNDYNMDDELVTRNHYLTSKGISAIPEIFVSPYYKDDMGYAYEYRPVVLVSFAIEHSLFGDNPHISHFFNVLLYALCCVLLFIVLKKLFRQYSMLLPLGIALLFAVHPAHTEVVCSIKNRDEILGLILSLLSLWFAIKAANANSKLYLLPVGLSFMLALMSKMTFIPFALLIPLGIILFTEAGFATVMLLSVVLAIVSFFMIDVGIFYYKILLEAGIIGGTGLLYIFMRPIKFSQSFSFDPSLISPDYFSGTPSSGIRFKWDNILPQRKDFSVLLSLMVVFCVFVFVLGMIWGNETVTLMGSILIIVIASFAVAGKKFVPDAGYFTCVFIGYLALVTHTANNTWLQVINDLVLSFFASELFFGSPKLRIPMLGFLLGMVIIYFTINTGFDPNHVLIFHVGFDPNHVLIFLVLFGLFRWSKGRWVLELFILATILSFFVKIHKHLVTHDWAFAGKNIAMALILGSIILGIYSKYIRPLLKIVLLLGIVILFPYNTIPDQMPVREHINKLGANLKTNIYTGKTDRPISFLENPVNANDPWIVRTVYLNEHSVPLSVQVVVPYPMSFYYGYKFIRPQKITDPVPMISAVLYIALFITAVFLIKRRRLLSFGIFVYLASVAAYSDIITPVPGLFADRFMLVPSLGWCIILALILFFTFKVEIRKDSDQIDNLPKGLKYAFSTVFLFYSVITFSRNLDWKDDLTLFRHDITYVDQSAQAHNLLALHLMQHSMSLNDRAEQEEYWKAAITQLRRSYQIYPYFYNVSFDLGRIYSLLNEADSAVFYFRKAISIDSTNSDAHLNIGRLLISQRKFSEAIPYFDYFIRKRPDEYAGYQNLSFIYYNLGDYPKSISVNQVAIKKLPLLPDPLINIAQTFLTMNQGDSAYVYAQRALQLAPNDLRLQKLLTNFQRVKQ